MKNYFPILIALLVVVLTSIFAVQYAIRPSTPSSVKQSAFVPRLVGEIAAMWPAQESVAIDDVQAMLNSIDASATWLEIDWSGDENGLACTVWVSDADHTTAIAVVEPERELVSLWDANGIAYVDSDEFFSGKDSKHGEWTLLCGVRSTE